MQIWILFAFRRRLKSLMVRENGLMPLHIA
jgi:hypothetical protein